MTIPKFGVNNLKEDELADQPRQKYIVEANVHHNESFLFPNLHVDVLTYIIKYSIVKLFFNTSAQLSRKKTFMSNPRSEWYPSHKRHTPDELRRMLAELIDETFKRFDEYDDVDTIRSDIVHGGEHPLNIVAFTFERVCSGLTRRMYDDVTRRSFEGRFDSLQERFIILQGLSYKWKTLTELFDFNGVELKL